MSEHDLDTNMPEANIHSSPQPRASKIGFDNLLEDIFGLNIRALKTIGISFTRPSHYIVASDDPDWLNRYTPSFRVWFGLFALYALLRFIYTDPDTAMTQMMVQSLESSLPDAAESGVQINTLKAAQEIMKWAFVFLPFFLIAFYALLAIIFRPFPVQTSYVMRLRYIFATVLPSTTLVLLSTFLLLLPLTIEQMMRVSLGTIIMVFVADLVTAYRGTFARTDSKNRAGLSLVFATLLIAIYMTASILTFMPAGAIAMRASAEPVQTLQLQPALESGESIDPQSD